MTKKQTPKENKASYGIGKIMDKKKKIKDKEFFDDCPICQAMKLTGESQKLEKEIEENLKKLNF